MSTVGNTADCDDAEPRAEHVSVDGTDRGELWLQEMTSFYQLFPYPGRGMFVFPHPEKMLYSHAGFARIMASGNLAWARRTWAACHPSRTTPFLRQSSQVKETRAELRKIFRASDLGVKSILLAGCGTDEPVLHAALHPRASIRAIDLSARSLRRATLKLRVFTFLHPIRMWRDLAGKRLVVFQKGDLVASLRQRPEQFDHIQCMGVIHHQKNPLQMLEVLADSMGAGGTLRLMLYSHTGRQLERAAQSQLRGSLSTASFGWRWRARMLLRALVLKTWYTKSFLMRSGNAFRRLQYTRGRLARIADALLHPSDPGLDPSQLVLRARERGLQMVYCSARSSSEGWISGCAGAAIVSEAWVRIAAAECAGELDSNIELIFSKPAEGV